MAEQIRQRWITVVLGGCLGSVVTALVAVALVNGLTVTSELSYGDLLVGLGTFALASVTAILASATYLIDSRAAQRENARLAREAASHQEHLAGIARFVIGELTACQEALRRLRGHKRWDSWDTLPHAGWDRYGVEILAALDDVDSTLLVTSVAEVFGFDDVLTKAFGSIRPADMEQLAEAFTRTIERLLALTECALGIVRQLIPIPHEPPD